MKHHRTRAFPTESHMFRTCTFHTESFFDADLGVTYHRWIFEGKVLC